MKIVYFHMPNKTQRKQFWNCAAVRQDLHPNDLILFQNKHNFGSSFFSKIIVFFYVVKLNKLCESQIYKKYVNVKEINKWHLFLWLIRISFRSQKWHWVFLSTGEVVKWNLGARNKSVSETSRMLRQNGMKDVYYIHGMNSEEWTYCLNRKNPCLTCSLLQEKGSG